MIAFILAETAGGGFSPEAVGTLIGAVVLSLLGGGLLGKKSGKTEGKAEGKAEAMLIGPQPFMVELKEQFVTRREFDRLEAVIAVNATEMKGLFRETMGAVTAQNASLGKRLDNQNDRLTRKIEEVAAGAYQGRQRIHNTQNDHTAKIAALEAIADVGAEIEKAGKVIADAIHPK